MSRSLIVLPDAGAAPLLAAIAAARKTLRVKMFVYSDPALLAAAIAAKKRGVDVRVMLNPARRSGESENEESRRKLVEAGVSVLDSNPAFDLTHEKSMVVDDAEAFVMSLNWETRNVTETRDYAVVDDARARGGRDRRVLRRRLEAAVVQAGRGLGAHLVQHQRPRALRRTSSTARSTRCGCRTSATRTP